MSLRYLLWHQLPSPATSTSLGCFPGPRLLGVCSDRAPQHLRPLCLPSQAHDRTTFSVRWQAIETFDGKFSSRTTDADVWSFGVLLFEIWSVDKPYSSFGSSLEVLEAVRAGHRLAQPPHCPAAVYEVMTNCWEPVGLRFTATEVVDQLEALRNLPELQ
eukprot:m.372535 g.372535  ORF g.372535 m.372535 type:complete len:159 (+) comp56147_c0_seq13:2421-2897(+)